MQVKSRTKNPKAIWQLSRLMAGASDVDRELIKAEWPDIPLNGTSPNYEGLRAWIMARPELADAVARIDPEEPPPDPPHRRGWKVADLMATEFPAPRWAVPELVPEGLSFLAGRPKMGKSWMALQLAHAVGTGGRFLNVVAERGPVLFYALEDGKSRIKDRVQRQGWDTDAAEVMFRFNLLDLATPEGLTQLQADIDKEDYKLVVIDTLSRAAKYKQLDIAESTDVVGELQKLAITQHRAVVLIDHYRKRVVVK